jgi:hypothetical protein
MSRFQFGMTATLAVTLWAVPVAAQSFQPRTELETRTLVSRGSLLSPRLDSPTPNQLRRLPHRPASIPSILRQAQSQPTAAEEPQSYMKRHPAKFGALVGAAAGAALAIITVATYDCPPKRSCSTMGVAFLTYPLIGAGLGATVGWVIKH